MKTRTQAAQAHASTRRIPQRAVKVRGTTTPRAARATASTTKRITRGSVTRINIGSHDTESEDDLANRKHSPVRPTPATGRKRAVAAESPDPLTLSHRAKRPRKRPGFYGEESESGESRKELLILSSDSDRQDSASLASYSKAPSSEQVGVDKRLALPSVEDAIPETVAEGPVIPAWASLPYFILVQVFRHALASMDDKPGVHWLLHASRLCRAFAEPALTALYECPPFLSRQMAHGLVELLAKDPSETLFNYRQKIEKLRIDVEEIASKTFRGQQLDYQILITRLPRLRTVDFFHRKDMPPFRALGVSLRWHYPASLLEALGVRIDSTAANSSTVLRNQSCAVRLSGWRWNRRLMGAGLDLQTMKSLHATPAFSGLKRISFVNYQVPSLDLRRIEEDDVISQDQDYIRNFAASIAALPELEYLAIESSTVVNGQLLPLLPQNLQCLTLINCWDVRADDFADFLLSHGRQLRHLILNHNQSLSLAFLTVLGPSCPNLITLSMDCKYFKHLEFYDDSEPDYSNILTVDQVPVWPGEIETIQLLNIRKWDVDAAEMFFQSLVDNAINLPRLRHLDLKLMLDIPFRSRIEFRDTWEPRLKNVFLRKWEEPFPVHSLRARVKDPAGPPILEEAKARQLQNLPPTRRSNRIATVVTRPNPPYRTSSVSRSLRNDRTRPSYAEPGTDDDLASGAESSASSESSEAAGDAQSSDARPGRVTHGMCEVVNIQLDNQKPTERILSMNDFMDAESDDPTDEDWDGDDDFDDDYAW